MTALAELEAATDTALSEMGQARFVAAPFRRLAEMRKAYCSLGPCHARADRWSYVLGWTWDPGVLDVWLEPERRKAGL